MLYSGNTYKHTADFAKHLNLQFVSSTHYYKTQKKTILFPVVEQTWIKSQSAILKQMSKAAVCMYVVMGGAIVLGIRLNMVHIP